jgi:drug/metabolite transporter (DMT)-like permease
MAAVPPTSPRGLRADEALVLVVLAAIWGASFLFIKVALDDVGPLTVVATRLALAAVGIGGWVVYRRGVGGLRRMLAGVRPADAVLLAATASAVPFVLISEAETEISSSLAGILNAAVPLLTAVLAFRLDPVGRLRGWRSVGLLIGFVGVALVAGSDISGSASGIAAMLGAVTLYAIGTHVAKLRFGAVDPLGVAFLQTATAAAMVVPLALVFDRPTHAPGLDTVASLGALGLGGTALAFCLFYWLLSRAGPQHTVAVTYLAPVFAIVYGAAILDERLTATALVGAVVIIAGEVVTAWPGRHQPRPTAVEALEEAAA